MGNEEESEWGGTMLPSGNGIQTHNTELPWRKQMFINDIRQPRLFSEVPIMAPQWGLWNQDHEEIL